ncbi:protein of unknown function [Taphrina deformans PYCC 5710]|uniref:Phospholipid/glycerol acyltransferase domain-containing protein n=1 Tax=Taphrina deformans (strain PYCC 5710 / ATCC 11124 / CBS 356.35 / IMI 108563 / JCM 9778 / NBRC 8474) TaxID=1097556 RepID=R4XKB2_TAPDE|nr:protein of unknown function [Taphrina deformans PYCC 5710]|eukprot:CCG84891.2 protein of unknown function [Taphrina deformans PYCC 5710]
MSEAQPSPPIFYQFARLVLFVCYFNCVCCIIQINQLIGLPLYYYSKAWYYAWIARTKQQFGMVCVTITQWFAPTTVVVSGDDSTARLLKSGAYGRIETGFDERMVLISNHQIYADWLFMWWAAYTSRMHGAFYIILKDSLKWIPIIGTAMQLFGFIFMARNWEKDKPAMERRLTQLRTDKDWPMWLLLYPEGTNLSPTTIEKARAYAKKTDGPLLQRTLLPRSTGLRFCLDNLKETVDYLYDCTIAYEPIGETIFAAQKYTLRSLFLEGKPPKRVHMHWRRFATKDIPMGEKEFEKWLYERFVEKDEMLINFYKVGHFENTKSIETAIGLRHLSEIADLWTPTVGLLLISKRSTRRPFKTADSASERSKQTFECLDKVQLGTVLEQSTRRRGLSPHSHSLTAEPNSRSPTIASVEHINYAPQA